MSRVVVLVLAAGALVWAGALMQFGARPAPAPQPSDDEPELVRKPPPTPVPRPHAQAPLHEPPPEPASAPAPAAKVPSGALSVVNTTLRAARRVLLPFSTAKRKGGPAPESAPALGPSQVATGELGEGSLSPEYAAMEREYSHEPRDGAWAAGEERAIQKLLQASPLGEHLALVNCQQSICRVLLEGAHEDAYSALLQVPGFASYSGLDARSPYSYRSGQLSVYFTRRSAAFPSGPP